MNFPVRNPPSKTAVLISCICVGVGWLIMLAVLLVVVGAAIGMAVGMPSRTPLSIGGIMAIFSGFTLLVVSGITYFILALRLRCPSCGYKFLKNPKGLGPAGFAYHSSCPKIPGFSPWAFQIGRFLRTRRMRCISCGGELFHAPNEVAQSRFAAND